MLNDTGPCQSRGEFNGRNEQWPYTLSLINGRPLYRWGTYDLDVGLNFIFKGSVAASGSIDDRTSLKRSDQISAQAVGLNAADRLTGSNGVSLFQVSVSVPNVTAKHTYIYPTDTNTWTYLAPGWRCAYKPLFNCISDSLSTDERFGPWTISDRPFSSQYLPGKFDELQSKMQVAMQSERQNSAILALNQSDQLGRDVFEKAKALDGAAALIEVLAEAGFANTLDRDLNFRVLAAGAPGSRMLRGEDWTLELQSYARTGNGWMTTVPLDKQLYAALYDKSVSRKDALAGLINRYFLQIEASGAPMPGATANSFQEFNWLVASTLTELDSTRIGVRTAEVMRLNVVPHVESLVKRNLVYLPVLSR